MRLELHYRSDVDLSQPAMRVEIRSHIARCLRDYPHGGGGAAPAVAAIARRARAASSKASGMRHCSTDARQLLRGTARKENDR
jgi:hypothetical protein